MKLSNSQHTLITVTLLLLVLMFAIAFFYLGYTPKNYFRIVHYWNTVEGHYPHIDGTLGCLDGIYEAEVIRVYNDSTVGTPLCEHSYGQLHGVWQFDDTRVVWNGYPILDYPITDYLITWQIKHYKVTVENNIIINAEEIK